jgi:hypothetical protein
VRVSQHALSPKEEGLPSRGRVTAPTSLVVLPALRGKLGDGEPVASTNVGSVVSFRSFWKKSRYVF